MRVQSLELEEELVHFLIRELDDLVFDRRAIARTDRLNLPAVHRRAVHVFSDDPVRLGSGPCDVTGHLRVMMLDAFRAEAKRRGILVARLRWKLGPIDGAAVETWRSSGLQTAS